MPQAYLRPFSVDGLNARSPMDGTDGADARRSVRETLRIDDMCPVLAEGARFLHNVRHVSVGSKLPAWTTA
jgi:hypothetical protein